MSDATPPENKQLSNREICNLMWGEDFFYSATALELVKRFFSYVLQEKAYHLSFRELRGELAASGWHSLDSMPEDDGKFVDWVCRNYLRIARAPSDFVADLYRKAARDIREVDARITGYEEKIQELRKPTKEQEVQGEREYSAKLHEHFIDLNKKARDEILEFIIHKVNYEALRLARKDLIKLPILMEFGKPYPYAWWKNRYKVESVTPVSNKFGELSVPEHQDLQDLYTRDKNEFYAKARLYITDHGIIDRTANRLDAHHHLIGRKAIIHQALDAYVAQNHLLFVNLVPLQIEGVFRDICFDLGLPASGSITSKAQLIRTKIGFFPHYEYYAFVFPVLRNRIAHGIPPKEEDLPWLADSLLLDLDDVCAIQTSNDIPLNLLVSALQKLKAAPDDLPALACYISASDISVPEFYQLKEVVLTAREHAEQWQAFHDLLCRLAERDDPVVTSGLLRILRFIDNHEVKKALTPKLKERKHDAYDMANFFWEVGRFR